MPVYPSAGADIIHIYRDQATILVQLGLLDPAGLPVAGREAAAKVLNPAIPGPHF